MLSFLFLKNQINRFGIKIFKKHQKDLEVNEYLLKNKWKVLRFWGKEVEKDLVNCMHKIENAIDEAKRKNNA